MWRALVWFISSFLQFQPNHGLPILDKLPQNYVIILPNSTRVSFRMINGRSVYKLFQQKFFCPSHSSSHDNLNTFNPLLDYDECIRFMDQVSESYYGTPYTPSLPTSTIEDYYSDHTDLLKYLISRFQYTKYLEIGCQNDINFNQIKNITEIAVGVDPVSGGTIRATSDEYFFQNDQIYSDRYDLIYIDGDHSAEQVWKDIKNSIMVLAENGTIVIHDLNPRIKDRSELMNTTVWLNSDGWKAAIAMRLARDYEIVIVDIDHGCGIIRKRRNLHPLPEELQKQLLVAGTLPDGTLPATHSLTYEQFDKHRTDFYRLMTLVQMREWLEESVA